jgi:hypothetical protein
MTAEASDRAAVRALLGREPLGTFDVVARSEAGEPVVIRNAPLLDDGTPMPTRYWLVGPREVLAVSRLEAAGGVRLAEAAVDAGELADAHRRYAEERDREVPPGAERRPTGGVAGTRQGVKCLHAHYAWHLAGGDDPVGRWVAQRLADRLDVELTPSATRFSYAGADLPIPVGPATLLAGELADPDPPTAAQLTNALGAVADHLDDVIRAQPGILEAHDVRVHGDEAWHLAAVEHGGGVSGPRALGRGAVEEIFRTLAIESRSDRLHNPGLDPERVDSVLGACCVVVAVMRRLHSTLVTIEPPDSMEHQ